MSRNGGAQVDVSTHPLGFPSGPDPDPDPDPLAYTDFGDCWQHPDGREITILTCYWTNEGEIGWTDDSIHDIRQTPAGLFPLLVDGFKYVGNKYLPPASRRGP